MINPLDILSNDRNRVGMATSPIKRQEMQRAYNFDVILPNLPISGVSGEEVSKYCIGVKFGDYDMEDVSKLHYGAKRSGYAGHLEIGDVVMEFVIPYPDKVSQYFLGWRNWVVTPYGNYLSKVAYAKTCYIKLYSTTMAVNTVYKLWGFFPKQTPTLDLNYDNEDFAKYYIEFNVDKITVV